jgi:hypothetical protein
MRVISYLFFPWLEMKTSPFLISELNKQGNVLCLRWLDLLQDKCLTKQHGSFYPQIPCSCLEDALLISRIEVTDFSTIWFDKPSKGRLICRKQGGSITVDISIKLSTYLVGDASQLMSITRATIIHGLIFLIFLLETLETCFIQLIKLARNL